MNSLKHLRRLPAFALAALLALSACGGGGGDSAPTPTPTPTPTTPQTITFVSPGAQIYATAPVALVATSTSGLTVAFASTTPAVCTVSNASLTLVTVGTCTVTASQPGDGTFVAAAPVTNSFAVTAAPQIITFVSPGDQALGAVPADLVATSNSGLTVSFESTTPTICTVSGTTLSLLGVGTCTVNASQAGNAIYAAAATVPGSFAVLPAGQTITFTSPGSQTLGIATVTFPAFSSSGLALAFTADAATVCTISGSTATTLTLALVSAGSCSVTASQPGNIGFAAATPVQVTFTVTAAPANGLANGGFEAAANGAGEFADGWQSNSGATRSSTFAHGGSFSAFMTITDGNPGGVGLFQNSVDHGLLLPVSQANWGTSPTLSFWLKGNTSETGNINYALRYLDSVGNILNQGSKGAVVVMNTNTERDWFQVTRTPNTVIPAGTTAVFFELTLAAGPSGTFPGCGAPPSVCTWGTPAVYVDDVVLTLLP